MRRRHVAFIILALVAGLIGNSVICFGQELSCTTLPDSLIAGGASSPYVGGPSAVSIALQIHVLREADGSGGLTQANVDSLISQIHSDFNAVGIYFVIEDSTNIDNSVYFADPISNAAAIFATDSNFDAIDLYLAPATSQSSGLAEGIPSTALILSVVPGEERTLSHFIGHCLGLFDTDETQFVSGGTPVSDDLVSDTPVDPGLAGWVNIDCTLASGFDPTYSPDIHNIMGSGRISCWTSFTDEQGSRILISVDSDIIRPFYGDNDWMYEDVTGTAKLDSLYTQTQNDYIVNSACFDYNGDGHKDLFLVKRYGVSSPIIVCKNQGIYSGDGVPEFDDETSVSIDGLSTPGIGLTGILAADYDNDGDIDFYTPNPNPHYLPNFFEYDEENEVFKDVYGDVGVNVGETINASWGDYDSDGFVDLLILEGSTESDPHSSGVSQIRLFQNIEVNGVRKFVETTSTGISVANERIWSSMWADFDLDHDLDLVMMQTLGNLSADPELGIYSRYYQNDGDGVFVNVTSTHLSDSGIYWEGSDGFASVGDADRDGDLDILYNRNSLVGWFENNTNPGGVSGSPIGKLSSGWFRERIPGENWTVTPSDLDVLDHNLDGYVDFFVSNKSDQSWLYTNNIINPGEDFTAGPPYTIATKDELFGSFAGDFNNDGFSELSVGKYWPHKELFYKAIIANDASPKPHWVSIRLKALNNSCNYLGLGATVTVFAENGNYRQAKVVDGGSGYVGQQDFDLVFGLGSTTSVDSVHVSWPRGQDQVIYPETVDTNYVIELDLPVLDIATVLGEVDYTFSEETIAWIFTWETASVSNQALDRVEFDTPVTFPGIGTVSVLSASTPNVQMSTSTNTDNGVCTHRVEWQDLPCIPKTKYDFTVFSGIKGLEYSGSSDIKVPYCAESD